MFTKRQKEIMNAAIDLIAEKSIQEMTIKNLSNRVGVTDGAIYRHFESKFHILHSILKFFINEAEEILQKSCSSDGLPSKQIEDIFLHHLKYFMERPAVASIIFSESIFQNDSKLSGEVFRLLEIHERNLYCLLEKGAKKGEINPHLNLKHASWLIIGSMRYAVTKWRLSHYNFNLYEEGVILLKTLKTALKYE